MANELILAVPTSESREGKPLALTPAQTLLRKMVLDSGPSPILGATTPGRSTTSSPFVPADLSPAPYS